MQPHTRAMVVASAHALIVRRKVAGLYDHAAGRHLRVAAEARGKHLQGYDGDRDSRFGGALPELTDAGERVHMAVENSTATGYAGGYFTAEVTERLVQLYDHVEGAWFAYDVQVVWKLGIGRAFMVDYSPAAFERL